MEYNHLEYMEDVATRLKDVAHTPGHRAFTTASGMGLLEGLMEGLTSLSFPALVAIDDFTSRLSDNNSDNVIETPFFMFCILKSASVNDSAAQRKAIRECKSIAKKVISKMRRSRKLKENGLNDLDMGSFLIQGVGPVGSGCYGCSVSFSLDQPAGIAYNESDWLQ